MGIAASLKQLGGGRRRSSASALACCVGVFALASCAAIGTGSSDAASQVDGRRALAHAEAIVAKGPHPPGSAAQREVGLYLIEQLKAVGLEVRTHAFTPVTPSGPIEMINIWGVLPGTQPGIIIIASHYDSKRFDKFEFVGANDGAASSGLVLELARVVAATVPAKNTFWFVFFDGEEALKVWTPADSLYGSREFVRRLRREGSLNQVQALILLDLVGARRVEFLQEQYSTKWLKNLIWEKAAELGYQKLFPLTAGTAIEDDHLPFQRAGVAVVDIIDLRYKHWHQPSDTIDKLSAENLAIVGEVVLESLPKISKRVAGNP